ncbi:hypothetical protein Acr_01g0009610 [Actinidia rufa]|uniref:Uncharacterized protein n=1 Tax=Actinidia rufa TaxID=165716 RepID=A0A7J0E4E6_9ERIC|nr:hypothetical protein Acr_01g0009610 [Actinidia rufa]
MFAGRWSEMVADAYEGKGQALADFLAAHPVPADSPLSEDFPDEEVMMTEYKHPLEMYFDGASREDGAGAGVVFVSPEHPPSLRRLAPSMMEIQEDAGPSSNLVSVYEVEIDDWRQPIVDFLQYGRLPEVSMGYEAELDRGDGTADPGNDKGLGRDALLE